MYKIIIFSDRLCSLCSLLKDKLKESKIIYQELDIKENEDIWCDVKKTTNINGTPIVYLMKEDSENGVFLLPYVDYNTIEELVEKIKINK